MSDDILIVDDEKDIRVLISGILEDHGYKTRQAANSDEALAAFNSRPPSLVILDVWLQGSQMDGLQILEAIRSKNDVVPIVMISGHGTIQMAVQAMQKGAYEFIEKPFETDRLLMTLQRGLEAYKLRAENARLKEKVGGVEELIGESQLLTQLKQTLTKVAPSNSRILIRGPAGCGKEVVSRQIHQQSLRANAPFISVNCASLHPDRLEEELFGIETGDKVVTKVGMFEQADGGTLLLDEVADMPLETQGKIVRALQEQKFLRVKGSTPVVVDVRVLATTNRDLNLEIKAGRFREDLYYRLNVVPIEIPALRHRREDIPSLVKYFNEKLSLMAGLPVRAVGADAMAFFQAYDWPGNIRQLKNVMEWVMIMAGQVPSKIITPEMLPPEITSSQRLNSIKSDSSLEMMSLPLREAREAFEREYLVAQVLRFGGNISKTAEFVGMERSALHRKLKLLGVNSNDNTNDNMPLAADG